LHSCSPPRRSEAAEEEEVRRLAYRIVNVFTRGGEKLSGNPLCVFEDGDSLSDSEMQALARQFNLSETTFILPSSKASARVRIFTPSYEMPFAGHPTLGTAQVCRALGRGGDRLTLEMKAGIIPVHADGARWTLQANTPVPREVATSRTRLATLLGLAERDLIDRPLWVSTGREQLIVPLANEDAVRRARPIPGAFDELKNNDGLGMAYVFAGLGGGRLFSRFFFPQGAAILEDPATGSATANLGGWFIAMKRKLPLAVTIAQGELVGRPSILDLTIDADSRVSVGGEVIELGAGAVTL
jgi:PhzF family phenazine biosynthesis protein